MVARFRSSLFVAAGVLPLVFAAHAHAAVKPHALFSDGAVLQQGMKVPVWGTAGDGEKVTVNFQGQDVSTTAKDGRWRAELGAVESGRAFRDDDCR